MKNETMSFDSIKLNLTPDAKEIFDKVTEEDIEAGNIWEKMLNTFGNIKILKSWLEKCELSLLEKEGKIHNAEYTVDSAVRIY